MDSLADQLLDKDKMIESLDYQLTTAQQDLHSLRSEVETMKSERSEGVETQRMVMHQIVNMKKLIEEQKQSERDKEQLLLKIKAKDQLIRDITTKQRMHTEGSDSNEVVNRLQHDNDARNLHHAQRLEAFEQKF